MREGDLRDETVGYAVAEGNESHDNERGEDVAYVPPVNLSDLADHHAADLQIPLDKTRTQ